MNLIAAVDENWGIGKDGGLLFHIPEDRKYFKEKTIGKVVVMGRGTFASLPGGRPLLGRTNIVLSADPSFRPEGVILARSIGGLKRMLQEYDSNTVFVIGGASLYNRLLESCRYAYITKVECGANADRFMHTLDGRAGWRLIERSAPGNYNGLAFTFNVYENSDVKPIE
ncbi:MAG TPA: hypothetical protein DEB31_11390 [Clostridiales bacterium]|nr:hypothetical protein [Clostridiales bacterium]